MPYCTIADVQAILAPNVTIGDANIGQPQPGRPGSGSGRSSVSPSLAQRYILFADSYIDARLRPVYVVPLRMTNVYQTPILQDISHGSNVNILVESSGAFNQWQIVRIQDKSNNETANVTGVPNLTTVQVDHIVNNYSASNGGMISILNFGEIITPIACRLAAAFCYDAIYTASNDPEISRYGVTQRNLATMALDDILRGVTLLVGQEMTGFRFIRTQVKDKWSSPADVAKGEEKE